MLPIVVDPNGMRVVLVERPGRVSTPTVCLEFEGPREVVRVELNVAAFKGLMNAARNVEAMLEGRGL